MGSSAAATWVETSLALALAVCASVLALGLSSRNMMLHARHYNFPRTQKYIFRILFVVPAYAICSCIGITAPTKQVVVVVALTVRDCYEAFVVYSFLTLILEHAGGDYNCIEQIKHLPPVLHPWPLCCLTPVRRDGNLLRLSKQATLQFVVVKPSMSILSLIALAAGQYFTPAFQITLLVVYNVSYSLALYGLLMFYKATRPLLTPFKPVRKFLAVKGVIFATYWQSVVVHFIPGLSSEQSMLWNDWLLCMELVAFALLLNSAFPWHDFITGEQDKPVLENVREMLSVRDVFQDAYHSFMPSYQDYVVARDDHDPNTGGAHGARATNGQRSRVVRTRTFLIGNLDREQMNKPGVSSSAGESRRHQVTGDGVRGAALEAGRTRDGPSRPSRKRFSREAEEDVEGGLVEDWGLDVDIIELHGDVVQSRRVWRGKSKGRDGKGATKSEPSGSNALGPETLESSKGQSTGVEVAAP